MDRTTFSRGAVATGVAVLVAVRVSLALGQAPTDAITAPIMFDTPEADRVVETLRVFLPDHAFNQKVTDWPVHPNSRRLVASVGLDKPLRYNADMAYVLVPPDQPKVDVAIVAYANESDEGPYPVPDNVPIEGWPVAFRRSGENGLSLQDVQRTGEGDRHAIVVDPASGLLYEFYRMRRTPRGWQADSEATFDLKSNQLRPEGWTSTDAAGLPIFPAVVRYDELRRGKIQHAMRVTIRRSRRAFVHPARHFASRHDDKDLPRMGERFRLRPDFDTSGFSPEARAILVGLQVYGMFVADNGIEWAISVTPDARIPNLHAELRRVKGRDFEVVVAPKLR